MKTPVSIIGAGTLGHISVDLLAEIVADAHLRAEGSTHDGFETCLHGVCRASAPKAAIRTFEKVYSLGWLFLAGDATQPVPALVAGFVVLMPVAQSLALSSPMTDSILANQPPMVASHHRRAVDQEWRPQAEAGTVARTRARHGGSAVEDTERAAGLSDRHPLPRGGAEAPAAATGRAPATDGPHRRCTAMLRRTGHPGPDRVPSGPAATRPMMCAWHGDLPATAPQTMSHPSFLLSLFEYKAWANAQLFDELDRLDADTHALERQTAIRLLNHIHVVDCIFAAHLSGTAQDYTATNTAQTPTLVAPRGAVAATDRRYLEHIATLVPSKLEERIAFRFTDGAQGCMSRGEMLAHVVTHGAYHRGAVGRIMAQAFVPPPRDIVTVLLHQAEPERRQRL
jgi:uncharacterized damage-inducible protein DinB